MTKSDAFNLTFEIARVARDNGDRECIVAADITLNYQKFWRITRGFATKMRELGVTRDSFVMVRTRDIIASLATLHAAALLGARYATYDPKLISGDLPNFAPPDILFHSPDEPPDPNFPSICITPDWVKAAPESESEDDFQGFSGPDSQWLLVNTSGTTGHPKYLWLTARQVLLRTIASQDDFQLGQTRFCALFPCNTRPFFARANAALLSGCAIVDTIDIQFMQHNRVDLFCASPRTAIEWLAGRTIEPKLPLIQVSGARLEPAQLRTLLRSFHIVEDVYGASETSKTHVNRFEVVDAKIRSHGRMLDSRVEIIDKDGGIITDAATPGLLRVSNPYINFNYVGSEPASDPARPQEYFQSGDLAAWGPQRELLILGRLDQLINLGGLKIDPTQVEECIQRAHAVTGAVVLAIPRPMTPPRLMAMVTLSNRSEADAAIAEIRTHCERELPPDAVPALIFVVHEIPRTGDGSPMRAQSRSLAEQLLSQAEKARQIRE